MTDSFYSQFGDTPAPEAPPQRERVAGQFANREDLSTPYVNKAPNHSAHYEQKEQKDESKIAYWRMFTNQMPKGEFEQNVNKRFGGRESIGGLFRERKLEYIALYKQMLEQWNNQ
jgi:hypothetical protein